jgi:hypothetical protein
MSTHDDPLVPFAAKALHGHPDWSNCTIDGACYDDAVTIVAALRPHIDAEKRAAVRAEQERIANAILAIEVIPSDSFRLGINGGLQRAALAARSIGGTP